MKLSRYGIKYDAVKLTPNILSSGVGIPVLVEESWKSHLWATVTLEEQGKWIYEISAGIY